MDIKECCEGMKEMIEHNTFLISSISGKGWVKLIEHDGTLDLGKEPVLHNYDITYCPFCGMKIEKQVDLFNKTDSP